jgi:hypothetical protein
MTGYSWDKRYILQRYIHKRYLGDLGSDRTIITLKYILEENGVGEIFKNINAYEETERPHMTDAICEDICIGF